MNVIRRLALRFAIMAPLAAALILLPAGTPWFWPGWVFLGIFIGSSIAFTAYFFRHDPQLLERRLQNSEPAKEQKLFRLMWIPLWIIGLALPGFDYRFGWSRSIAGGAPSWLIVLADAFVLCGFLVVFQVMRANTFASSTIRVETGQKVVSTGPYRIVRHPMYSGFLLLILATPLALGSYVALPVFALLLPVLVYRLINEEKTLRRELAGYADYCQRTRFRLVPFVY
jgi:protein-S-isoprenylcysteine O-methyltransferase Ste14